jgi:hypothetical protein
VKPKIAALITASGGIGSHLVLHKLQGHKNLVTLTEGAFRSQGGSTKGDLKRYLSQGEMPSFRDEQLFPIKKINSQESKWIILNKPPLKMINYHRTFHPDIPILYIFRNPVSFYYTWIKKWKEYGERRYGKTVSDDRVFEWFKNTFMSSLFELAQTFRSGTDHIISFEHFFNDIDFELERIFKCLDVPVVKNEDLKVLDKCNVCGTEKVIRKEVHVRGERFEEVLCCHRHGPCLGPGEYNYIRKEDSSFLNKWKVKPDQAEVCKKFSSLFGDGLIKYYLEEGYLEDKDRKIFDKLIQEFLEGLRRE